MSDPKEELPPALRERLAAIAGGAVTTDESAAREQRSAAMVARDGLAPDPVRSAMAVSTPQRELIRRRGVGAGYLTARGEHLIAPGGDELLWLFS